jgi:hypothetical protein
MKILLFTLALLPIAVASLPAQESETPAWNFSTSLSAYYFPPDETFVLPILYADRGPLHLEARYNYEARETGSLFVGRKFTWISGEVEGEVTPMIGLALGDVDGVAPGVELDLLLDPVEFYTEGEFMMDFGVGASSFFYFWSELTVAPTEWLNAGLVSQRTRTLETPLDIQRGFLVGGSYSDIGLTFYMFNPDENPYYVFTLKAAF